MSVALILRDSASPSLGHEVVFIPGSNGPARVPVLHVSMPPAGQSRMSVSLSIDQVDALYNQLGNWLAAKRPVPRVPLIEGGLT